MPLRWHSIRCAMSSRKSIGFSVLVCRNILSQKSSKRVSKNIAHREELEYSFRFAVLCFYVEFWALNFWITGCVFFALPTLPPFPGKFCWLMPDALLMQYSTVYVMDISLSSLVVWRFRLYHFQCAHWSALRIRTVVLASTFCSETIISHGSPFLADGPRKPCSSGF